MAVLSLERASLTVRLARSEDVPQLTEITSDEARRSLATASYIDEPLERWERAYQEHHRSMPWLVATDSSRPEGQEVLGYAKASPYNVRDGFRWSVELSVYVRHEVKGRRIGEKLYQALFRLLAIQGYRRVYARIALPNPASIRLHERFGLAQTGTLPAFAWKFGNWYDMAIYTGLIHVDQRDASEAQSGSLLSEAHSAPPLDEVMSVERAWELYAEESSTQDAVSSSRDS